MQIVIPVDVEEKPKRRPPPRFASMIKTSEPTPRRESADSQLSAVNMNSSLRDSDLSVFWVGIS